MISRIAVKKSWGINMMRQNHINFVYSDKKWGYGYHF